MPLPVSQIAADQINLELQRPSTNELSLDETPVRGLAQRLRADFPAGTISFQDFHGKALSTRRTINVPYAAPANNVSITTTNPVISPQYVAGETDIVVQVASGVVIGSSTGDFAMSVSGFHTADTVTINNEGYIVGAGGGGGGGGVGLQPGGGGGGGGWALNVSGINTPTININNTGMIAGGGGGGGGGGGAQHSTPRPIPQRGPIVNRHSGGAGGGGAGQVGGGTPGQNGANPGGFNYWGWGGSGAIYPFGRTGGGGQGGTWGTPGNPGGSAPQQGGGGGGAGGGYIYALGKPVNWINTGTVYGPTA